MVPLASIETGQGGLGDGAIQAPKPRPSCGVFYWFGDPQAEPQSFMPQDYFHNPLKIWCPEHDSNVWPFP